MFPIYLDGLVHPLTVPAHVFSAHKAVTEDCKAEVAQPLGQPIGGLPLACVVIEPRFGSRQATIASSHVSPWRVMNR